MNKLLIANWKMNLPREEAVSLAKKISIFLKKEKVENASSISIAPSMPMLNEIGEIILQNNMKLVAQDCSGKDNGAYTGEVSTKILKEYGCEYVILGHSERRKYQMETSELILQKTILAYRYGLTPIICVGETADERTQGITLDVLNKQLMPLSSLQNCSNKKLVIAYEPVWAIGSDEIPTKEQIQEVIHYIKNIIHSKSSISTENLKILYGGSVTSQNCQELLRISGVGGLLIGGASLVYDKFIRILKNAFEMEKALI